MLQDRYVSVAFNKGLDTKTDPKQVMPGSLLVLQNATFISPEEIRKRNGYTALTLNVIDGTSISVGNSLGVFNDSLALCSNDNLYSYSESDTKWASKGNKTAITLTSTSIAANASSTSSGQPSPSIAVHSSGIELLLYDNTAGSLKYEYLDSGNGAPITTGTATGTSGTLRDTKILVFGSNFLSLVQTATALYFNISSATSPVTSMAFSSLISSSTKRFLAVAQNTTHFFVAYNDGSGHPNLAKYTSSGVIVGSPVSLSGSAYDIAAVAVDTTNSYIWVSWSSGTTLNLAIYDYSLNQILAPTNIGSLAAAANAMTSVVVSGSYVAIYTGANTSPNESVERSYYKLSGGTFHNTIFQYNGYLQGSAFLDSNSNVYVPMLWPSRVQQTYFLVKDLNPAVSSSGNDSTSVVAKYAPGTAFAEFPTAIRGVQSVVTLNSTDFYYPCLTITQTIDVQGNLQYYYGVTQIKFTIGTNLNSVALGNNLNIGGGILSVYDGLGVAESGFNLFPEYLTKTTHTSGGLIPDGTYSYVAVYAWTDNMGNRHRSAPSTAVSATISGGGGLGSVDLSVLGLDLTEAYKKANVVVEFYRTTNGGTTYYSVTNNPPANNPSGNVTLTDTNSDTVLVGNTQLYTNGGEVDNIAPPAMNLMVAFKNRIIGVQADNPYSWWYSKQVIQGSPVEFSDLFVQNIDAKGGPITAITTMDDKLIFFVKYGLYYVTGDGPAPSGANNDFTYPQAVVSDVGCTNQNSIVAIPDGVMFQSQKGIYLLGRGLAVSYIGAPVEAFNSYTITSAVLVPNTTQVRFTLSGISTVLVYDYFIHQWSTFTGLSGVDAVVYNNAYCFLKSNGTVMEESPSLYTDDGAAVGIGVTTGWFSFANVQGFQRVREMLLLLEAESNTTLSVAFCYDFNTTQYAVSPVTITSASAPNYRFFLPQQKCEAVQIVITETPSATFGEGLRLSAMGFNVGVKKGLYKLPASQSNG